MTKAEKPLLWVLSWVTNEDCPSFNSVKFSSLFWAVVIFIRLKMRHHKCITLKRYRGPQPHDTP